MDNKSLLKGTLVYTLSNVVTKMGSLVFLPIITRLLTVEEYGIVGMLEPIATLFAVFLGLGIYNAQMKKYVDLKDDPKEFGSFLFSSFFVIIVFNLLVFLFLITPFSKKLFSYIIDLNKIDYNSLIILTIVIGFVNALNTLAMTLFRMKKMYRKVAFGSLIKLFSNYFLAIYFIKYMKLGALGNQIANFSAVVLLLVYFFKDYFGKFNFKFKKKYMDYSIRNGLPLIFIELTDQIVNFSDRIVLGKFIPIAIVGAYSLAFTGGRALSVITGSFINSWTPEFYEEMKTDRNNPKITKSLETFLGIISFACVIAQLFAPEAIKIIFPKSYAAAIDFIPYVLAGIVIQALVCLDYFFHFHEDSMYIFYFSVFAMAFNLIGNLILIPNFKSYGVFIALWTTILAFLLRAVAEMVVIKRKYHISFNYRKMFFYLIILLNPAIFYLSNHEVSWMKFALKIVYLGIIAKILINKEVAEKIKNIFKKFVKR